MDGAFKAGIFGLSFGIFGVLLSLVPFMDGLEENAGLDWLFTFRGPRPSPSDVVIVNIDKLSADALELPNDPDKWPRAFHAQLIDNLNEAGAALIVFDIFFKEQRDIDGDLALARAIKAAGNVILFENTEKEITQLYNQSGNVAGEIVVQRPAPPIPVLAEAARALAPFPLPIKPVKLSQFWTFIPGTGDRPTLPVVAFQLFELRYFSNLLSLYSSSTVKTVVKTKAPPTRYLNETEILEEKMRALRIAFKDDPSLKTRMLDGLAGLCSDKILTARHPKLRKLIDLYSGADSRYLNFYGPPQAITSVPYIRVLNPGFPLKHHDKPVNLKGKVVFVGFSARLQPQQKDDFYSVFSEDSGLSLSGVELAATAFANLLEGKLVIPIPTPTHWFVLLCWGTLIGFLCRILNFFPAILNSVGLCCLYLGASNYLFQQFALWIPLVVPLFLQCPLAVFVGLVSNYLRANRERERIRGAFGYYLPSTAVDKIVKEKAQAQPQGELMYGTCLSTDAENYTGLSEGMDPTELASLMNNYYQSLFRPVRRHDGFISDVLGDSMLAIWATRNPDLISRRNAIKAALEIYSMAWLPKDEKASQNLPTRIGLHSGHVLLGAIGALDHFEYRAVGDIVNTSTRIQGLNKYLGTKVLLSQEVLQDIEEFPVRDVGIFLLIGKTRPITVYELLADRFDKIDQGKIEDLSVFDQGLNAFRSGNWPIAIEAFEYLTTPREADGVARFYLNLSRHYRLQPPGENWNGTVSLERK